VRRARRVTVRMAFAGVEMTAIGPPELRPWRCREGERAMRAIYRIWLGALLVLVVPKNLTQKLTSPIINSHGPPSFCYS